MTIDEIRERLLELARTHRVTEEDADLLERTEVELYAAFEELERCRDRIKRLEEAGDKLLRESDDDANINRWLDAKEVKP